MGTLRRGRGQGAEAVGAHLGCLTLAHWLARVTSAAGFLQRATRIKFAQKNPHQLVQIFQHGFYSADPLPKPCCGSEPRERALSFLTKPRQRCAAMKSDVNVEAVILRAFRLAPLLSIIV